MACHTREWRIRDRRVRYQRKTADEPLGRFGGGWQWEVGFQVAGSTVILNFLIFSLRIERKKKRRHARST